MTLSDLDVSRTVSHALRHEPWLYELELDDEGWVPVDQLLAALREKGGAWKSVDRASLERMLEAASKCRHELDDERIRALYGHSLPGRVLRRPGTPPARLFHGTPPEARAAIEAQGLLPMQRQFVHLSVDREIAKSVGLRKCASPVILAVDTAAAASAGITFYEGNEFVWLVDRVPAPFIEIVE